MNINDLKTKMIVAVNNGNLSAIKRYLDSWEEFRKEENKKNKVSHIPSKNDPRIETFRKVVKLHCSNAKIYNNKLKEGKRTLKVYHGITSEKADNFIHIVETVFSNLVYTGYHFEKRQVGFELYPVAGKKTIVKYNVVLHLDPLKTGEL